MDNIHNPNDAQTSILNFDERPIRMIDKDGEPWWIAADVCAVLGLSQTTRALSRLADDERGVTSSKTPGGIQEINIVNESGLYTLIIRSRKPEAERFRRWITHEVLPSLRKTGIYIVPGGAAETIESAGALALLQGFDEMRAQLSRIEDGMTEARREARALPAPNCLFPELTNVGQIHVAARAFSALSGTRINAVWPLVYSEIEFRYKIRLGARAKKAAWKGSVLNYAIASGHGDLIYTVLWHLIRRAGPSNSLPMAA